MKILFTQALFFLLSFSQAIGSAKPIANPYAPAALNTHSLLDSDIIDRYDTPQHTPWVKRVPAPAVSLSKSLIGVSRGLPMCQSQLDRIGRDKPSAR